MNNHRILASALHKIVMEEKNPFRITILSNAVSLLFPDEDFHRNERNLMNLILDSKYDESNENYEVYAKQYKELLLNFLMYQKTNI